MKKRLAAILLLLSLDAAAGIQVVQTRVIYKSNEKSASLSITNDTNDTWMVQTWLDTGDATQTPENLPIQVVPPLMKLAGNKDAILRFIYSGKGLPADREMVYWINVQEIPPAAKDVNVLQIAVRTRIKLFYRPAALKTTLDHVSRNLTWHKQGNKLVVTNKGPLHVTFGKLTLNHGSKSWPLNADMVKPMGSLTIDLPNAATAANKLTFTYINDFGGNTEVKDIHIN